MFDRHHHGDFSRAHQYKIAASMNRMRTVQLLQKE